MNQRSIATFAMMITQSVSSLGTPAGMNFAKTPTKTFSTIKSSNRARATFSNALSKAVVKRLLMIF